MSRSVRVVADGSTRLVVPDELSIDPGLAPDVPVFARHDHTAGISTRGRG